MLRAPANPVFVRCAGECTDGTISVGKGEGGAATIETLRPHSTIRKQFDLTAVIPNGCETGEAYEQCFGEPLEMRLRRQDGAGTWTWASSSDMRSTSHTPERTK